MPYIGKQPANVPVTADDIPNDSITAAKIVDAAITIDDIGPNAVGSSEMADDAVGLNELSASGTTNSSTFLRGDNTWAAPPATDISGKLSLSGGTMTGNLTAPNIYVADDIVHSGDTDTYLSWNANNLTIYNGGTNNLYMDVGKAVFNEGGGGVDFRVESNNNTHALFVQGSDGNVGISTDSPASVLNIKTTKTVALSSMAHFLTLGLTIDDSTAYGTAGGGGGIAFRSPRNSSGVQTIYGAIDGAKEGTANDGYTGALRFYTNNNSTGVPTEHMRITSSGNVGIGDTDPSEAKLSIDNIASGDMGLKIVNTQDTHGLYISNAGTVQPAIETIGWAGIMGNQTIANGYAGYFTRNLAEAGSYPCFQVRDNNASNTQAAVYVKQNGAGYGLYIDQNGNSNALKIDSEATGNWAAKISGKYGLQVEQDISGGYAAEFYRNLDEAGSSALVYIDDSHTSNTQPALKVRQDGAGQGIYIDHNGDGDALLIETTATTQDGIQIEADSLTTGRVLNLYSHSSDTSTRDLVRIWNDNPAATGTTALKVIQDAAQYGLDIDMNANHYAFHIDTTSTTNPAMEIEANSLTTGQAARFYSNSASGSSRNLVEIHNDHASASGTNALKVQQDGAGKGIEIEQNGNANAIRIDCDATGDDAVRVFCKYGIKVDQDIAGGYAAMFKRDLDDAGSNALVYINDENAANTQAALKVKQDGAGYGVHIAQQGNGNGLYVDSAATSNTVIKSRGKLALGCTQDISGGYAAHFDRNIAEAGTYPLVNIKEDNASSTQPALFIQQAGAGYGLKIDHNGNYTALYIDSASTSTGGVIEVEGNSLTSGRGMNIVSNSITTGSLAQFYSNSSDTNTRDLVKIVNDSTSATGATALMIQQDAGAYGLEIDQNSSGEWAAFMDSAAYGLDISAPTWGLRVSSGKATIADGVMVGATTWAASTDMLYVESDGTIDTGKSTTSSARHHGFYNANGEVGSIRTSGSATAFNTSSDYRLKENVDYTWDATTRLKQLKPARFNFIADDTKTVDGFLAHEVSSVVPEAITGTKDAMMDEEYEVTPAVKDEEGNIVTEAVMGTRSVPEHQSIDQSKLVPLLVKTIQELEARITTLENA